MSVLNRVPRRKRYSQAIERLKPHAFYALLPLELISFMSMQSLLSQCGSGEGQPVLIVPGFTGSDGSTKPLRWALERHGYNSVPWGLGRNFGPTIEVTRCLRKLVDTLYQKHSQTISLVGWSLGGVMARSLARECPEKIRQVITLGSPYRMISDEPVNSATSTLLKQAFDRFRVDHDPSFEILRIPEHERAPLTVPTTSIYSRHDNIAAWPQCIDEIGPGAPNPRAENIEVRTSHVGVATNLSVLAVILDRLRQPENNWQPFQPSEQLRVLYPTPAAWTMDLEIKQKIGIQHM